MSCGLLQRGQYSGTGDEASAIPPDVKKTAKPANRLRQLRRIAVPFLVQANPFTPKPK